MIFSFNLGCQNVVKKRISQQKQFLNENHFKFQKKCSIFFTSET